MKHLLQIILLMTILFGSMLLLGSCNSGKNIGLQLYSVRDAMKEDPIATVEQVGEMGYSFVEAANYDDGLFYGMAPQEFSELLKKNGLGFISSHTGRPVPDQDTWEETMAWWDKCISAHKEAGVKYIVQPSMQKTAYESKEGLLAYCKYFEAVGEKCNAKGIRFGYHNHAREFTTEYDGEVLYDIMLENMDPDKVFMQIDLYWIMKGGKDAVAYFDKYPGRFDLWHVKDEEVIGASGTMDFETLFANNKKSGMKYYIVEVERYETTPVEDVKKSFEFLMNAEYVK
ncbi:sugar phosphate isomerase/epimerase family protein [Bacteroidota bacterium]